MSIVFAKKVEKFYIFLMKKPPSEKGGFFCFFDRKSTGKY